MADHIQPSTASVVGVVTDTKWGQVLQTPHAYGVLEVHTSDAAARVRGVQHLTKLTHTFDTPPVSLAELSQLADSLADEEVVSLILLVPVGSILYLVSRGEGSVYLKRGTKLARLMTGNQALSGALQPEDTIIAATQGFVSAMSEQEIIGVFDHLSAEEVAEKLTIRLHEREGGEGGAALILQAMPEEERVAVEEVPVTKTIVSARRPFKGYVKAVGRKMLTVNQRVKLRALITRMRENKAFSPKRIALFAVILFFIVSVVLGIRRQITYGAQTKISETLVSAQHSFDEGVALMDVNPVKGRERLAAARDLLAPVVSRKLRSEEGRKAKELFDAVTENLTRAMQAYTVKPQLFFDMALLKDGGSASDMALFDDTLGILDVGNRSVSALGATTKNGKIVGGGESFTGASQIAAYGDKLYVLTPKGIHEVRTGDQKTTSAKIPAATEWGTIADMIAFGGNLYLLDTAKSRIWKYVATEKGFSELFEYLNPDAFPDLSHATNMAIDGSVWLGTSNGRILRFTSGKENSFPTQGLPSPLGNSLKLYVHDEAKMVYVLDADNGRVVVFDKDGLYMSQYVWEKSFAPSSFAVSEELGKIFLLRDGKIYVIDLK